MSNNISSSNSLGQLLGYLQQQSQTGNALTNASRLKTTEQEVVFLSRLPDLSQAKPADSISQMQSRFSLMQTTLTQIQQFRQRMTSSVQVLDKLSTSKKDAARQQLTLLKQRIEVMKKMLAFVDPQTAKNLLRQIKQMAGELKAAAQTLGENSGGSNNSNTSLGNLAAGTAETSSASAETTTAADTATPASDNADSATSASAAAQTLLDNSHSTVSSQNSNNEDAKLIRDVMLQLKALHNALKSISRRSSTTRQQYADTDKLLKDTAKILGNMTGSTGITGLGNLNINVSTGKDA